MIKRRLSAVSILLAVLLASTSVFSCGEAAESDPKGTETSEAKSEETTSDPRLAIDDGLPEKDFGGYEFRILSAYYGKSPTIPVFAPEEASGDVVDDAVYARNQRVEDRFNCKIVEIDSGKSDWNEHTQMIKNSVLAGDDNYDLTLNHIIGGPNISLDGVFMNLNDLKYLDFSKPWWSEQMIDEFTVRNQIYLVGDVVGLDALKNAKVHFLNKKKFAEYGLELPYEQVFSGTWTLDKLISLTKDVYEDVNGNTERDVEDFYGYVSHSSQNGWLVSCDVPVLEKDPDKTLKIVVNGDKVASLVEKLYKWYFEAKGSLIIKGNDPVTGAVQSDWQALLFASGHGLVAFAQIKHATSTFRESNVEYGIIPFPKWDEKQESYRTFSGSNLIGVPITVSDPERTSIIFEALTAETYKTVVPAYFGTALKEKFTYDSESGQSLDIINDTLTISFAYAYDNWQGFGHMLGAILASDTPSADYASFYAGRITSAETRLKLITDFFEANE